MLELERSIAAATRGWGASPWGELRLNAYLARRIYNLGSKIMLTVFDHFAEGILDSGIVAVYEVAVHELHRERRFP